MDRPRIVSYNIASVDGRLTIAPGVVLMAGDARWTDIAGEEDPYAWIWRIHHPDVLLEGSGSLVARDAPPIAYPAAEEDLAPATGHHLPSHTVEVPGRRWLAVVDGRGRVQWQFAESPDPAWAGWHVLVLASRATPPAHLARLREDGIPYLVAGDGPVDLAAAMALLWRELGVRTVVSSGGGRLNGALLRADLVDEVDVELLPAVIGGRGTPALFDAPPLEPSQAPAALRLLSNETTEDGRVRLRYAVLRSGR